MKKIFLTILAISILLNLSACNTTPQKDSHNQQTVKITYHPEHEDKFAVSQGSTRDFYYTQDVKKNNAIFLEKMNKMGILCETGYDMTTDIGIKCKKPTIYYQYYTVPSLHAIFQAPLSPIVSGSFLTPERESELIPQVKNNKIYAIDRNYLYLADEIIAHDYDISLGFSKIKNGKIERIDSFKGKQTRDEDFIELREIVSYWELKENPENLSFTEIIKKELGQDSTDFPSQCPETLDENAVKDLQCYGSVYYQSGYDYYYTFQFRMVHLHTLNPGFISPIQLFVK